MIRAVILSIIFSSCVAVALCGGGCQKKPLSANEELRIPADEIDTYKRKAQDGNADAAKKLWHHYTFVEGDLPQGKKWKALYNELSTKSGKGSGN